MKRAITLITAIAIMSSSVVFASDGKLEVPAEKAGSFSEGLAKVGVWKGYWEYGYIDKTGKLIIELKYNKASDFHDGAAVVGIGKDYNTRKYGYIKKDGSILYPIELDYAKDFSDGYAIVGKHTSGKLKYGIMDKTGKIIAKINYDNIDMGYNFKNYGYAVVENKGLKGILNLSNGQVTETKYSSVIFFDDYVLASEKKNGTEKFGIIYYSGKVVEPKFDWVYYYDGADGVIAMVEIGGKFGLLKKDGSYALEPMYDEIRQFADLTSQIKKDGKYGYMDDNGSMLTKIEFDEVTAFVKGVSYVKKNGMWGLLNRDGSYKIEPKYEQLIIVDGSVQAYENGVKKLLTADGNYKFDPTYEYMYPYASIEGAYKVKKNNKEIIINSYGKALFDVDFDTIGGFGDIYPNLAYVTLNGKTGYLDTDGNYRVKPIYDGSFKDLDKDYFHTKINEKWGIVFSDGTSIEPKYDGPLNFEGDIGIARLNGKQTYIKRNGILLTSETFDQANSFKNGMGLVYLNGKTGYVDGNGKKLDKTFDFGMEFNSGYALVYDKGKYRYIDKKGNFAFGYGYMGGTFSYSKSFSNGYAPVMNSMGRWGFIDGTGVLKIGDRFNGAYGFFGDVQKGAIFAPVVEDGKVKLIDTYGNYFIDKDFDYASGFDVVDNVSVVSYEGLLGTVDFEGNFALGLSAVKSSAYVSKEMSEGIMPMKFVDPTSGRELYGYVKSDGSWLVKPQFDYAVKFNSGYGQVFVNGKQGKVSIKGDISWN